MKRATLAASAVGLLVLAALATTFVAGVGPAPGLPAGGSNVTTSPDGGATTTSGATTTDRGSGSGSTTTTDGGTGTGDASTATTRTTTTPPFTFTIDRIEQCGTTCRNVTATLYNRQSGAATGVSVTTRIYAGNSTADGDQVWHGSEDVGRLDAGGSYTTTREVHLSYADALAVQQADGWITVQTTVRTDDRTITFTRRRHVG